MASGKSDEEKFTEYLDKIMAGEKFSIGEDVSDDLRAAIEFARRLYAEQELPSADFTERLWNRLLVRLNNLESDAGETKPEGFWERAKEFFSEWRPAWQVIVSAAAVLLVIIIGTVWYSVGNRPEQAPMSLTALPPGKSGINLPQNNHATPLSFYLDTKLSTTSEQVPVYQVIQPDITFDYVRTLGRKLDFNGEPAWEDNGTAIIMTGSTEGLTRQLVVWAQSGAIEYGFTNPDRLYPSHTPVLPAPDTSKKLAYDYLKKLDLLPAGYHSFDDIKDKITLEAGGAYNIIDENTGNIIQKDASFWLISFPFYIDGVTATGPGAKIEVSIGENGELVHLVWAWREVKPAYNGDTKSEQQAFDDIVNDRGSMDIPASCQRVLINKVTLSYWINPISEQQDYAMPVYIFNGDCLDNNGGYMESFHAWTQALQPAY